MRNKNKVIYIGGYGHSGSTILECLLSVDDSVIGMGELFRLHEEWDSSYTKKLMNEENECSSLYKSLESSLNEIHENIHSIEKFNKYERLFLNSENKKDYKNYWSSFFQSLSPDFSKTIIDSSKSSHKSFFRLKRLHNIESIEVSLIHLIRKPENILQKAIQRNSKRHENFGLFRKTYIASKTAISWFIANLVYIYKPACTYSIISFEDLCDFPKKSLQVIGDKHGIDVNDAIRKIETRSILPNTCAISGNMKVRKKEGLYFDPDRKKTDDIHFIVKMYSFFLNIMYRYIIKKSV